MSSTIYYNVFFMLGGIAIMMFGMKFMGSNLEQLAGNKMKKMLGKMTTNRFAGVGVGAMVTAIINSSTATTVMLVGFVNVGLLTLAQATSVIMGANIGTTITAQILSLSGDGQALDMNAIAAILAAAGMVLTMVVKSDKIKKLGYILVGVGMIFIGLKLMSKSVDSIIYTNVGGKKVLMPIFETIFQNENIFPIILIVVGIVFTALIQSSAAITGILIALGSAINFRTAVFIILGSNIGTCITSIISSIGTSTNAKRTAIIHLLFNLFGCLICIIPIWIWTKEVGNFMYLISGDSMERIIANFHTLFNLLTTIVLLPFTSVMVKMANKIIPEHTEAPDAYKFAFIDNRLLETPAIAADATKKELVRMSEISKENVNFSIEMLLDEEKDNTETIRENEKVINHLNQSITAYLTKLVSKDLSDEDDKKIGSYFHVVSDIERIGDYAENIMEYAHRLRKEESSFSLDARSELLELVSTFNNLYEASISAFQTRNVEKLAEVDELEQKMDDISAQLENKHISRVKEGACTAQLGSVYLQTVSNLERVGDHITNVAFSIRHYRHIDKNKPLKQ